MSADVEVAAYPVSAGVEPAVESDASVETVSQRGDAFVVRVNDDAERGVARVYDSALARLYPGRPLAEIMAAGVRAFGVRPWNVPAIGSGDWSDPRRQVSAGEIAAAERVECVSSDLEAAG